jgi:hypothetical protein
VKSLALLVMFAACGTEPAPFTDDGAHIGAITVASVDTTNPPLRAGNAYASFQRAAACERDALVGPCRVMKSCASLPTDTPSFSAGAITFENTTEPVVLAPRTDGSYHVHVADQTLFEPGDTIAITSEGDEAPALATTLVAPARATVTSRLGTSPIDRTRGLAIAWTGVTTGDVYIAVSGGGTSTTSFDCRFPASVGHGEIPPAVLSQMNREGFLSVGAVASEIYRVDSWSIELAVVFEALWPDGALAQADVTFAD